MTNNSFTIWRFFHGIKTIPVLLPFVVVMTSCEKSSSPVTPSSQFPDTNPVLKYQGVFQPTSGISISGTAKVHKKNNAYQLIPDSFRISNGPDLKVYLSKEYPPSNFINPCTLQVISGLPLQVYNIPGMPGFSEYKYALIHCQQYSYLFGIAILIS